MFWLGLACWLGTLSAYGLADELRKRRSFGGVAACGYVAVACGLALAAMGAAIWWTWETPSFTVEQGQGGRQKLALAVLLVWPYALMAWGGFAAWGGLRMSRQASGRLDPSHPRSR